MVIMDESYFIDLLMNWFFCVSKLMIIKNWANYVGIVTGRFHFGAFVCLSVRFMMFIVKHNSTNFQASTIHLLTYN